MAAFRNRCSFFLFPAPPLVFPFASPSPLRHATAWPWHPCLNAEGRPAGPALAPRSGTVQAWIVGSSPTMTMGGMTGTTANAVPSANPVYPSWSPPHRLLLFPAPTPAFQLSFPSPHFVMPRLDRGIHA